MAKHSLWMCTLLLLVGSLATGNRISAAAQSANAPNLLNPHYLVIDAANYDKYSPAVAYDSVHDEYLVVWEAINGTHTIYGRRITGYGVLLGTFLISNAASTNNRLNPAVAYDPVKDRYLVVWSYDFFGDGSDWDVYGRYIPWNGPSAGLAEFSIASDRHNETKPKVTYNTVNGDFLVAWLSDITADHPIYGILMHNNGAYTGLDIASGGSAVRDFPDVAFNSGLNQYLVTWDELNAGTGLDVYAVRLDSLGAKVPPGEIAVANSTVSEQHPKAAGCSTANQFFLVYQRTRNGATDDDIYGSFLTGSGATGPFFVGGTTAPQYDPAVACNFAGSQYFVAWTDMYASPQYRLGIWGMYFNPDGSSTSDFEIVAPSALADRTVPAVSRGKNTVLIAWEHGRDNPVYVDIWGVVLGGVTKFDYLPIVVR